MYTSEVLFQKKRFLKHMGPLLDSKEFKEDSLEAFLECKVDLFNGGGTQEICDPET